MTELDEGGEACTWRRVRVRGSGSLSGTRSGRGRGAVGARSGRGRSWYSLRVIPSDTHPDVEAILIEGYRRMSVAEKMSRVVALSRAVQQLGLVDVRRAHPEAEERELSLRLASRRLDAETMRRAFGWDPDVQGY